MMAVGEHIIQRSSGGVGHSQPFCVCQDSPPLVLHPLSCILILRMGISPC